VWQLAELWTHDVYFTDVMGPDYFPFLTFDDLLAASEYWDNNQKEIADAIRANNDQGHEAV
jgi:hypothetical protein